MHTGLRMRENERTKIAADTNNREAEDLASLGAGKSVFKNGYRFRVGYIPGRDRVAFEPDNFRHLQIVPPAFSRGYLPPRGI